MKKRFASPTSSTQVNAVIGPTAGMVRKLKLEK